MRIQTLKLSTFRNITNAKLEVDGAQVVALVGENGAGKTSILESLSLLSPGRGLNKAKHDEIIKEGAAGWGVHVALQNGAGSHTVGMALQKPGGRKIKIDEADTARQTALSGLGQVVWFTPKMDRLFLDSAAARRDFWDRLTFTLLPAHAQDLSAYKYHLKNRSRLLKDGIKEGDWLALEEEKIVTHAMSVMENRLSALEMLNEHLKNVSLQVVGAEKILQEDDPLTEMLRTYEGNRARDARVGDTSFGPHRSDVEGVLNLEEKTVPLHRASSGQHKRALVEVLMAQARLLTAENGHPPLVLLDEISAHLDKETRDKLLNELAILGAQVWLAGTDENVFKGVAAAHVVKVVAGEIFK